MFQYKQTMLGKFNTFVLKEILTTTAHCIIYKGEDRRGVPLIAKRSHDTVDNVNLLKKEVACYKQLSHPFICAYIGYEEVNDSHFLLVEFCQLGSLRDLLDQGISFSEQDLKKTIYSILLSLEYIHKKNIIHRDVKCANILVTETKMIKLADFGHSALFGNREDETFIANSMKGTLYWMAPEVIMQKEYDTKADIWSLGCTIIELVTGKLPWRHFANYYEAMNIIGRTNEMPEVPEETSDELKDLIECCLKRNPRERKSASELLMHSYFADI